MQRRQEELFYDSQYELRRQKRTLYEAVYDTLERNSIYREKDSNDFLLPYDIAHSDTGITISDIKKILDSKGYNYQSEEINLIIYNLLSREKRIIRKDYWTSPPKYEFLDSYYWDSRFQQQFHTLKDEETGKKVFALMSDTHIGLDTIYNPQIINNFYEYLIKHGIKRLFHLGDLFEGVKHLPASEKEKEYHRQLQLFIDEYPCPNPEELLTYLTGGNHDEQIGLLMGNCPIKHIEPQINSPSYYAGAIEYQKEEYNELRYITALNQSLICMPQTKFAISGWSSNINGRNIHFNHEFFLSFMQENVKINSLDELAENSRFLDYNYDILISGHLHQGFIYSIPNPYKDEDNIYLSVPSTSTINIGKAVGYVVELSEDGLDMEISVLGSDEFANIHEIDRISWNFQKKSKTYSKLL